MPHDNKYKPINDPQFEKLQPSNFEDIDHAMYDWLNGDLNLHCQTNTGWKKTPIIWASAERNFQVKSDQKLRDKDGAFILPIASLQRISVSKAKDPRGSFYGNTLPHNDYRRGVIPISTRVMQEKTANFANADSLKRYGTQDSKTSQQSTINFRIGRKNKKIVYETIYIPIPVYLEIDYEIKLKTEYQAQMNELVSPFIVYPGSVNYFMLERNNHRYECFIQPGFDQSNTTSNMTGEARIFETTIKIKSNAHIVAAGNNEETPVISVRESMAEFKIQRERVVMGDKIERELNNTVYRS
jgi:hypothetical protein